MKIVFHAVAARKGKEGGATYLLSEMARALAEVRPEHEYVYCLDESLEIDLPEGSRRIDVSAGRGVARLKWDQTEYPRIVRREQADLSVAALGFGPVRPGAPQVTMHPDSTYFCRYARVGRGPRARLAIALRRRLMQATVRASRLAIVPSQSMADGLQATYGRATPTRLVRYGWEGTLREPRAQAKADPVKLLYVSHLQRHKAHLHLIPLAQELKQLGVDFEIAICISRDDDPALHDMLINSIRDARLDKKFVITGRVSPERLDELYAESDVFVYPSLCESFGFAMVEATAAGLPVVAADTQINREILGPGAGYFPPMDPAAGAEGVKRLAENPQARVDSAISSQRHQADLIPTWKESATRLVEAFEEAVAE